MANKLVVKVITDSNISSGINGFNFGYFSVSFYTLFFLVLSSGFFFLSSSRISPFWCLSLCLSLHPCYTNMVLFRGWRAKTI